MFIRTYQNQKQRHKLSVVQVKLGTQMSLTLGILIDVLVVTTNADLLLNRNFARTANTSRSVQVYSQLFEKTFSTLTVSFRSSFDIKILPSCRSETLLKPTFLVSRYFFL
jgi:hypothetical protein